MIESKPGISFIDFEAPFHAGLAYNMVQDYPVTDKHMMSVSYARG